MEAIYFCKNIIYYILLCSHGCPETQYDEKRSVCSMVMEEITVGAARKIAESKNLKPGRVVGTNGIQFTKGSNTRIEAIDWNEFEKTLSERGLAVFESGGWMKIMKKA
ncbi:MAG: hypothetical protein QGH39_07175 [Candidatus Thermoplasmatota archaeon]|nr:hypothetical protein [Candidatus Thermoplasmatota archaeon]